MNQSKLNGNPRLPAAQIGAPFSPLGTLSFSLCCHLSLPLVIWSSPPPSLYPLGRPFPPEEFFGSWPTDFFLAVFLPLACLHFPASLAQLLSRYLFGDFVGVLPLPLLSTIIIVDLGLVLSVSSFCLLCGYSEYGRTAGGDPGSNGPSFFSGPRHHPNYPLFFRCPVSIDQVAPRELPQF